MDADQWNARYEGARLWADVPPRVFQEVVSEWVPGRGLDLATGDGRNAVWMAQRGWAVTGVDFSSEAVIRGSALARAESTKVRWLVEDITSWSADEQFDLVTMLYLHLPAKQNRRMLDRAAEWVLPGGHLVVLGHDLSNLEAGAPGPLDPDVLYSTELGFSLQVHANTSVRTSVARSGRRSREC